MHLNAQHSVERQRFTKCHEFAHIYLNHWSGQVEHEKAEGEANFFANYLLVPTVLMVDWFGSEPNLGAVQRMFGVSFDVACKSSK